ncbi:MAG: MAPEG family protein [Pseudomonadota bacterium]
MSTELTVLALAGLLQVAQYVAMAVPANLELGARYTLSPRDTDRMTDLSPLAARLYRALGNHFEALILFTLAVTVVTLGDRGSPATAACAWIYLAARVLYVPAYALGLAPWRSLIWSAGFLATVAMLILALI